MVYDGFFKELEKIEQAAATEASDTRYAFNIFSLLRRDDDEVGLHSKFLAELLSPTGSHGIGTFQKLFINQVLNAAVEGQAWARVPLCSSKYYNCYTEVPIKNFGRIDIVLKNEDTIIVIENKIHAYDQEHQLQRYFDACISMGYAPESIYILYLNKYGDPVSAFGKGNLEDIDFAQISYKKDIANWLDACVTEAKPYPHIEQTLLQYRRLVGKLTGDTRSAKMKEAHIEMLYRQDNFKLAHELSKSFQNFQIDLQKKVWSKLQAAFEQKGYDFDFCDSDLQLCNINKKIERYYKPQKPTRNYGIQCKIGTFGNYDIHCLIQVYSNIYYGITVSRNSKRILYPNELDSLAAAIGSLDVGMVDSGENWFLGGNLKPSTPIMFLKAETLYKIANDDDRVQWVQQTTNEIILFIENVKGLGIIDVQ